MKPCFVIILNQKLHGHCGAQLHSFDLRRFLANTSQTNFRKFQEVSNLEFRTLCPRIDKGEQRQGDLTYL